MYQMKEEYLTGIELIDKEHEKLFTIADRLYHLINDEFIPDKYDYIVEVLNELKDYAQRHFADEEAYMESINYKRMFTQKVQHAQFTNKINSISLHSIDESQKKFCLEILEYINDWLVTHILENDLLIAEG